MLPTFLATLKTHWFVPKKLIDLPIIIWETIWDELVIIKSSTMY